MKTKKIPQTPAPPKAVPANNSAVGFPIPQGAIPLCTIFAVPEGDHEKIGIILNEKLDPGQIKFALEHAVNIANERMKLVQNSQFQQNPQVQPKPPKFTDLLQE